MSSRLGDAAVGKVIEEGVVCPTILRNSLFTTAAMDNVDQNPTTSTVTTSFVGTIRIYHECEGRIEKSVSRITVWHHEACRVMTNCDLEGRIFLSDSPPNNGFVFFLTIRHYVLFLRRGSQKYLNTPRCDML